MGRKNSPGQRPVAHEHRRSRGCGCLAMLTVRPRRKNGRREHGRAEFRNDDNEEGNTNAHSSSQTPCRAPRKVFPRRTPYQRLTKAVMVQLAGARVQVTSSDVVQAWATNIKQPCVKVKEGKESARESEVSVRSNAATFQTTHDDTRRRAVLDDLCADDGVGDEEPEQRGHAACVNSGEGC